MYLERWADFGRCSNLCANLSASRTLVSLRPSGWGRTRVLGIDGAIEVGLTMETALTVLEQEAFPSGLEPFVRAARTVLYEAHKSLGIALATDDPEAERQNLLAGTEAVARAFVAARVFLASPADDARETAAAMRAAAPAFVR